WPFNNSNAKCQSLTLQEQLDAGIRFIDIRVKQDTHDGKPDFGIYHGKTNLNWSGLWFSSDIVAVCNQFLVDHPTETILMSVKDEWGSTTDFEQNLKLHLTSDNCLLTTFVPALQQARGKIVLFRRYEFGTAGIPAWKDWPPDEAKPDAFVIQDAAGSNVEVSI